MGLDAFVRCRCWQDGLTNPLPVAREFVTEVEGDLCLTLPWEGSEESHARFDRWVAEGACPHPDMERASEHIANWSGYRLFQHALDAGGGQIRFPVLCARLPDANGGTLEPEEARLALEELCRFDGLADLGTKTILLDEDTGQTVTTHVAAYRGVFIYARAYRAGIDPGGFFLWDGGADPPTELFRSRRFTQEALADRSVRFTALDRAAEVTLAEIAPLGAARRSDTAGYPRRLRVDTVRRTPQEFAHIVQPLTAVCEASVETGNPVIWC
ncbi:hypothetical protein AB0I72_07870 [Nocardiopsis sp. NPDC049922]|uniref:hypothetical protein n=1 Tax=Nocardiopsis sp. NPDC049922 TaxID=3155157 RepID=UPI0033D78B6D